MSYDLILLAPRGVRFSRHKAKTLLEAIDTETTLNGPCEVIDAWDEPDSFDVDTLEECFLGGDFSRSEYEAFCSKHALTPEANKEAACQAARLFLDFKCGQSLIMLALHSNKDILCDIYRQIVDFARRHNLVLDDPQMGDNIDLENPGETPPMF